MDEFKFVLRCFVFACLLLMFSQVKTDGVTYEARIQNFLMNSEVAFFMQDAAAGGVKAIKKALLTSKAVISDKIENKSDSHFEKNAADNSY